MIDLESFEPKRRICPYYRREGLCSVSDTFSQNNNCDYDFNIDNFRECFAYLFQVRESGLNDE
jgi:hypothetical protein